MLSLWRGSNVERCYWRIILLRGDMRAVSTQRVGLELLAERTVEVDSTGTFRRELKRVMREEQFRWAEWHSLPDTI